MKPMYTYSDLRGRSVNLTPDEIRFFEDKAGRAAEITGCNCQILPYDFDLYGEDGKEALGRIGTRDIKNRRNASAGTVITIDTYFIHECYMAEVAGDRVYRALHKQDDCSLNKTLAHEIAHLRYWKHGKQHTRLTEKYLEMLSA